MQLPPKNYDAMVKRANPPSPVVKDCLWAFFVGGAICLLGEALRQFYLSWYDKDLAGTLTSITLVMLSAITTVPGWYQKLAAKAGAGTLVPITGFAKDEEIHRDLQELYRTMVPEPYYRGNVNFFGA